MSDVEPKPIKKSDLEVSNENPRDPTADDADLAVDDVTLVKNMRERLLADVDLLRSDRDKMKDMQSKALFEKAIKMILEMVQTFSDYEKKPSL